MRLRRAEQNSSLRRAQSASATAWSRGAPEGGPGGYAVISGGEQKTTPVIRSVEGRVGVKRSTSNHPSAILRSFAALRRSPTQSPRGSPAQDDGGINRPNVRIVHYPKSPVSLRAVGAISRCSAFEKPSAYSFCGYNTPVGGWAPRFSRDFSYVALTTAAEIVICIFIPVHKL